jgi:hypothetical protein
VRETRGEVLILKLERIEALRLLGDLFARDFVAAEQLRGNLRRGTKARYNGDPGKTAKKTGRR